MMRVRVSLDVVVVVVVEVVRQRRVSRRHSSGRV